MTFYQVFTRLRHLFTARHWRGAAIHSPAMYDFVRRFALKNRKSKLISAINAPVIENVSQLTDYHQGIVILREPFKSRSEEKLFKEWFAANHVVVAHFQGLMVVFFDPKRQKQFFIIRN